MSGSEQKINRNARKGGIKGGKRKKGREI